VQIIPTFFYYFNSFSQGKIIPKHHNVECIVPSGILVVAIAGRQKVPWL
jgi:hypothetical protein